MKAAAVDPFVRSCLLTVLIAAAPALLYAALDLGPPSEPIQPVYMLALAALLTGFYLAGARHSNVWRTPTQVNVVFFTLVTVAVALS
jgi:hypothetical protein